MQRLADGRNAGIVEGRALDVVEADHGDVFGNAEPVVPYGPDSATGGDIVATNDGREMHPAIDQLAGGPVAEFRRGDPELELNGHLGPHHNAEFSGQIFQALPALVCVGAVAAAAHESDGAVTKLVEMAQRQFCRLALIEHYVGDSGNLAMTG